MFCKRCRYNLKLITSRSCPECGRAFDPGNPRTYRETVGWPKGVRRFVQSLLLLFILLLIALGVNEVRYQRELAAAKALKAIRTDVFWSYEANRWAKPIPFLHRRLQRVECLYLCFTRLTVLPPEICNFTEMTQLNLSRNQLATLPPEIGRLVRLQDLDVSFNPLTILPPEIGSSRNLQRLILSGTNLVSLPPEIGDLTSLTDLDISASALATLPPEMGKLTNLKELSLQSTNISDEDLKHLTSLKRLKKLALFDTNVTEQGVVALQLALPTCWIYSDFHARMSWP